MTNGNESVESKNDSLADKLSDAIQKFIEENGITEMVCIAKNKESGDDAAIFFKGHVYDITKLTGDVYDKFKNKLLKDLY